MTKAQYPSIHASTDLSTQLDQLQRRLGDLAACLDWVLENQSLGQGRYPTAIERTMQLSLPLRWLAERAQLELAALQDLMSEARDQVWQNPRGDGE